MFCSPLLGGDFVDLVFLKAYYLTSFLKHVNPLVAGAFAYYSVLIKLPLIFQKKQQQQHVIKAVEVVFKQFELDK